MHDQGGKGGCVMIANLFVMLTCKECDCVVGALSPELELNDLKYHFELGERVVIGLGSEVVKSHEGHHLFLSYGLERVD